MSVRRRARIMPKILRVPSLAVLLMCLPACDDAQKTPPPAVVLDAELERQYKRSCVSCHISGAAGAPRISDKTRWSQVLRKGMPVLVANVRNGYNAMPPMGLCQQCDDEDFRRMIEYMAAGGR